MNKDILNIQKLYDNVINAGRLITENRDIWGSILIPEVRKALLDWSKNDTSDGVVIGGCLMGIYGKPRNTTDGDVLYLNGESSLPSQVEGFKRTRNHAFTHNSTGVEIEVLTPEYLKLSPDVVHYVRDSVVLSGGIKIVSRNALIVLKCQRLNPHDKSDIFSIFENMENFPSEILYLLDDKRKNILNELWEESRNANYKLDDD